MTLVLVFAKVLACVCSVREAYRSFIPLRTTKL